MASTDLKNYTPIMFQLLNPFGHRVTNYSLIMHVNPNSMSRSRTKKLERIQTQSGWVEQHWGEEVIEVSVKSSTGAFIHLQKGLVGEAVLRRDTIAYDRYLDLLELYRTNGAVYATDGTLIFQGRVVMNYGVGQRNEEIYEGYFTSFGVEETADKPHLFDINFNFKSILTKSLVRA
jgi:phosphoribosylformylglycinamidine (FGAM) synthase-like amidotransferase family enzyme